MKRFEPLGALLILAIATGCDKREAECNAVVGSMRSLGKKLAQAQKVTSSENATAQHVASALRTFAKEASNTGETLATTKFTLPELEQIATDAGGAALSLADSARRMVNAAERIKGVEPAQHAARIQRTLADVAAANLLRHCASNPTECTALSNVLLTRPPLPDPTVDPEQTVAWNGKLTAWLGELDALQQLGPELQHQIANLEQTSKSYATALTTLAASHDVASELTAATQAFGAKITAVDAALTAAQDFCKP
jgi:hypothetical protein